MSPKIEASNIANEAKVLVKPHSTNADNMYNLQVLEGTECTVAWCSVDNWQLLTYDVYFYEELKVSNKERQVVLF